MKDKKNILKLTTKVHTRSGIISFILGLLSIVLFCIAVIISAFYDRNTLSIQYKIGIIETIAIILSLVGIVYGVIGETKVENLRLFAHLGVGANVIAIVFHIIVIVFSYSFS